MATVLPPEVFCLLGNPFLAQAHSESCSFHQAERIPPLVIGHFNKEECSDQKIGGPGAWAPKVGEEERSTNEPREQKEN